ncbi:GNAT family N-acetyltransferase [Plantactinospora sp. S1510]|uniref:GNAT family N-acetyltransferase n=1 Tax=Plantactinospora alkalitolerans TaxID=2789879 RepID=A0ABS0H7H7_9ACTN|nr:GNAT family N-acetyltransferase [Plantactinospora alkalitolerans]MBF9134432.1 GNAT family N-acetyltransferase [Plantactinospora alkalitolerans]
MTDLDADLLRTVYDAQLRARVPDPVPPGVTVERDGPLLRIKGLDQGGFLTYRDLAGLAGAELDELIVRQRDHFDMLGQQVEWKLHGHDEPADLAERLRAAGFVPEERETVVIGPVAPLAATLPVPPEGVRLREVTSRADLDRIAELKSQIWGADGGWLADGLERELAAGAELDQPPLTIVVAEAGDELVSAGWVRFVPGTRFATLWGGSTLPHWRRRGIYRALLTYRARLADARGFNLLQVDASEDSRPILERLGLVSVTTTTPYVYTPTRDATAER